MKFKSYASWLFLGTASALLSFYWMLNNNVNEYRYFLIQGILLMILYKIEKIYDEL